MLHSHYYANQAGSGTNTRGSVRPYRTKVYNFPPVRVFEEQRGFTFFMPCLASRHRKGLSVLLGNGTLKFSGLRCSPCSGDKDVVGLQEARDEKCHKTFHIAVPVRENAVEIVYEDDFLLVWVPKEGEVEASVDGESIRDLSSQEPGAQDHSSEDLNSRKPGVQDHSARDPSVEKPVTAEKSYQPEVSEVGETNRI